MKAAVVEQFKEPLKLKEVEKPTISYGWCCKTRVKTQNCA
jgi:D-arabinose 1-dehydrogenase-like Zn-dependent alcohol dehydrogenase